MIFLAALCWFYGNVPWFFCVSSFSCCLKSNNEESIVLRHSLFGTFCIIFISLLHMECVFRSMLHSLSACSSPRDLLGHFASSTKLPHLLLAASRRFSFIAAFFARLLVVACCFVYQRGAGCLCARQLRPMVRSPALLRATSAPLASA
jgi:hypothetical protein